MSMVKVGLIALLVAGACIGAIALREQMDFRRLPAMPEPAEGGQEAEHSAPVVAVRVARVQAGTLGRTLVADGTVAAASGAVRALVAPCELRVVSLSVARNASVAAGAAIATVQLSPAAAADRARDEATLRSAVASADLARARLAAHLATRVELQAAEAALELARADAARWPACDAAGCWTLTAGIGGSVSSVPSAVGATVPAGATLAEIVGTGRIARLGILPADALQLAVGHAVSISFPSLPSQGALSGEILHVAQELDAQTHLQVVDARLEAALPIGTPLIGTMSMRTVQGWILPRSAVVLRQDQPTVFRLAGERVSRVAVHALAVEGEQACVSGPLQSGDEVVSAGATILEDGELVHADR